MATRSKRGALKRLALNRVYRCLEPGPVILVSTFRDGKANVMTASSHVVLLPDPPRVGLGLGPWNHSYEALVSSGECVIAVPGADLAEKVMDIGNCSGADVDKFQRFRLTALPAGLVAPPLIGQCLYNLECRVCDDRLVEEHFFFIFDVVRAWVNPARKERRTLHHNGDGTFTLSGRTINLKERMVRWPEFTAD